MQNKLHYAATGKTAAEIVKTRADHLLPNMGLTSWKGTDVAKGDVTVAKNYLTETEIAELNRIVVMWLDYAEDQAKMRKQIYMRDWEEKLNGFLAFNERQVLPGAGTVSHEAAEHHAKEEYGQYTRKRREDKENFGFEESVKHLMGGLRRLPGGEAKAEKKSKK